MITITPGKIEQLAPVHTVKPAGPVFYNAQNHDVTAMAALTNRQLREWAQDNGFMPAKNATKATYIRLITAALNNAEA